MANSRYSASAEPGSGINHPPGDFAPYLTRDQVAAILQISEPTLRRWASDGRGPRTTKVGSRMVRYHKDDVRAFLEAGQPLASHG